MREIRTKNFDNPPSYLINAREEAEQIALEINLDLIRDKVYKGNKIVVEEQDDPYYGDEEFEGRYLLRKLFYNKCAYCERTEYKPDVEHFRPKKKVTGDQGNNHGYYWLCYEWSNLLPSCSACNSGNGKWDKFPVLSRRVTRPPLDVDGRLNFELCRADSLFLLSEQPALLHPEIDKPETFFELDWDGRLLSIDGHSRRGWYTWQVCDLNRGNLLHARKSIIKDYIRDFKSIFILYRNDIIRSATDLMLALKIILTVIIEKSDKKQEYSFVSLFILQNFSAFIEDNFEDLTSEEREILQQSFQELT